MAAGRRTTSHRGMVDEQGTQARPGGAGMTAEVECRYYGRSFTTEKMALLRALIAVHPRPTRFELSKESCRIGWIKPDGGLKDMMAKAPGRPHHAAAAHADTRQGRPGHLRTRHRSAPVPAALDDVWPLTLRPVLGKNRVRPRLPRNWAERYNTTPVLIGTFVQIPRYTGSVYKASGWIHVGATQGRGRYDRGKLYDKPKRTSGSGLSERTGNEPSTAELNCSITARPKDYPSRPGHRVDHVLIVPARITRSFERRVLLTCFQLVTGGGR